MSWLCTILILCFTSTTHFSIAQHHHKKHNSPSAVLVGTVYCHTCSLQLPDQLHLLPGASLTIQCNDTHFQQQLTTDNHGRFTLRLPFPVAKRARTIIGSAQVELLTTKIKTGDIGSPSELGIMKNIDARQLNFKHIFMVAALVIPALAAFLYKK